MNADATVALNISLRVAIFLLPIWVHLPTMKPEPASKSPPDSRRDRECKWTECPRLPGRRLDPRFHPPLNPPSLRVSVRYFDLNDDTLVLRNFDLAGKHI